MGLQLTFECLLIVNGDHQTAIKPTQYYDTTNAHSQLIVLIMLKPQALLCAMVVN